MNPEITVVIAAYNCESWIAATVGDVQVQTHTDWELIVVDDASTDGTESVVRKLAEKDPRIFYVKQGVGSGSPAKPRNEGLKRARGNWISFLDHDDRWIPTRLEKTLACFKSDPQLVLVCHSEEVVTNGKVTGVNHYGPTSQKLYEEMVLTGNRVSTSASLIRTDAVRALGGFNESKDFFLVEDFDLWLRLAREGYGFKFLNQVLGKYILHAQNWTRSLEKNYAQERRYFEALIARDPERLAKVAGKILGRLEFAYGRRQHGEGQFQEARIRYLRALRAGYKRPIVAMAYGIALMHLKI